MNEIEETISARCFSCLTSCMQDYRLTNINTAGLRMYAKYKEKGISPMATSEELDAFIGAAWRECRVKLNKQGKTATTRGLWAAFRVSQKTWRRAKYEKFFSFQHAILIK